MSLGSPLTRMLAEAFLSSHWSLDELEARGKLVLQLSGNRKWYSRFISIIFSQFAVAPSRSNLIACIEFVSRRFYKSLQKLPPPTLLRLPRQEMQPASGLPADIRVPPLVSTGDLADWLGISLGELNWFEDRYRIEFVDAESPLRHYRYRSLKKSSGRLRLLEIPKPRLMDIQRQILHEILDQVPPHPMAHAFRSGRSVATYVAGHCGREVLLHIDLQDFFPSIRASRIHALWRAVGYPERVARSLTALCTHRAREDAFTTLDGITFEPSAPALYRQRHLPQGAPTSPALANLCAHRLDVRLTALAARFGATYSRYADDLLFSGDTELRRGMSRFRVHVLSIALDEGFSIQARKTRVVHQSQSQRVAGLILNTHPNPARHDYDNLKAQLFNCVRHGPDTQNHAHHNHFAEHLRGRIAYFTMINPQRGAKLQSLFDQIRWD